MTSTNIALPGIAVLLTMSGPLSRAVGQRPSTAPVVIANVNVLPLDRDGVLAARTVVVERGIISRIGPARSTPTPGGSTTIDGTGKYLMPGLVDLHVHPGERGLRAAA